MPGATFSGQADTAIVRNRHFAPSLKLISRARWSTARIFAAQDRALRGRTWPVRREQHGREAFTHFAAELLLDCVPSLSLFPLAPVWTERTSPSNRSMPRIAKLR